MLPGGAALGVFEPPETELIGLAFAVVVLILAFGSVLAMGLPIAVALGGVGAGIASIIIISALFIFLHYSRFGYAIRATTQNRAAAQLMGVNVGFVCLITFGIGLGLAGAAGALVSFIFSFFPAKHWDWIAILLSLIVLGGMGKLHGLIVATLVLSVIATFVGTYFGATWSGITFYLALFLILLIRPEGMFGDKIEES